MPIHDFGPLKRIEDAEKEIEEGKAKEIKRGEKIAIPKPGIVKPPIQKKDDHARTEHKQKRDEKPKKVHKKEIKKTSHPLVHGTLEIEEEEL